MEPGSTPPSSPPARTRRPVEPDGAAWTWRYRPDFGHWARELRKVANLTLREAASALDISFTKLQKLEVGGRAKAPSMVLLGRIATLYGRDLDLVLLRAGFKTAVPDDLRDVVRCDDAFSTLVLHPALRPACMDERWLEAFSPMQKAQWLDFTRRFEAHLRGGGEGLDELLREERDDDPTEQK